LCLFCPLSLCSVVFPAIPMLRVSPLSACVALKLISTVQAEKLRIASK